MRFYLDEDLPPRIASIARQMGVDVMSTTECRRNGQPDEQQLLFAAEQGRTIVTRNYDDFHRLTTEFHLAGKPHAGVLLVPGSLRSRNYSAVATAICRYDQEHLDGMPSYMVDYLAAVRG